MKNILLLAALATSIFTSNSTNAQVKINVQFGVPVAQQSWYAGDNEYYYMPEQGIYYNVRRRVYVYPEAGNWLFASRLPSRYGNHTYRNSRYVRLNDRRPFERDNDYRSRYHDGNNRGYNRYDRGYNRYDRGSNRHAHGRWDNRRDNDRHDDGRNGQNDRNGHNDRNDRYNQNDNRNDRDNRNDDYRNDRDNRNDNNRNNRNDRDNRNDNSRGDRGGRPLDNRQPRVVK